MSVELLLEVFSNSPTLVHEARLQAGAVPRVGEFVALPPDIQEWTNNMAHALVYEVEWLLDNGTLTPVVRCRVYDYDAAITHRLNCLEELGWLQPRD